MSENLALVAGASGFIGRRIIEHLQKDGWQAIALSRGVPAGTRTDWISVDLRHPVANLHALLPRPATHVFYAARFSHEEGSPESVETNTAMLRNLVTAAESGGALRHVHAVHGSRYYGHRTLDLAMPMREDYPRGGEDNFYFAQEDFLRSASAGKRWRFSTSRPHVFCDTADDQRRSIVLAIGLYAAIRRELNEPLAFPGTSRGFQVLGQFTDVALLARAVVWMAKSRECAGLGMNVVNGDVLSWAALWPALAGFFRMRPGPPAELQLEQYMHDKAPVWDAIVRRHGLKSTRLHELADWPHADVLFRRTRDIYSSMDVAKALGFVDRVNSIEMFPRQMSELVAGKVLPPF